MQERDERNHASSALFPHRRAYFTKGAFFDKQGEMLTPWLWKLPQEPLAKASDKSQVHPRKAGQE